jgi:HAE1 family hydrophobic/amphiphilic exporter-1
MIMMILAGIVALTKLNVQFFPSFELDTISISTSWTGASAEDVEMDVTKILEDEFVTLPNYKSMTSKSNNSYSYIEVTFNDGLDPYDQLEGIRYRISQLLDDLPENLLGEPQVMVGGGDLLPVLIISVSAGDDIGKVSDYAINDLKPRFNQIAGVSSVNIKGDKDLQVSVKLRLDDLVAKKISVVDVYESLKSNNVKLPLGTGEYQGKSIDIRYKGDFNTIADIQGLPVGVGDNNVIIRMRDVADVTLDYEVPEYYVDGAKGELVVVEISKRSGGNIIEITDAAKEIMKEETLKSGGVLNFEIIDDTSKFTKVAINTVLQSGLQGLIFAILVIALFLGNFRATLIISLSTVIIRSFKVVNESPSISLNYSIFWNIFLEFSLSYLRTAEKTL